MVLHLFVPTQIRVEHIMVMVYPIGLTISIRIPKAEIIR